MHTNLLIFHIISKIGLQVYEINKNNMFFLLNLLAKIKSASSLARSLQQRSYKILYLSLVSTLTSLHGLLKICLI